MYICICIYICKLFQEKMHACIQLKFHAICNQQVYHLYYALKLTKIYIKNNASKNYIK